MDKIGLMLIPDDLQLDLFKEFTNSQLEEVAPLFSRHHYLAGNVILRQNQPATKLFIVIKGEVEIRHLLYDGPSMEVDRLTSGDVFGWSAVLGREVYTATVTAAKETSLLSISSTKLHQFCDQHHDTGVVLLKKMASTVSHHPTQPVDLIMDLINHAMECHHEQLIKEQ